MARDGVTIREESFFKIVVQLSVKVRRMAHRDKKLIKI